MPQHKGFPFKKQATLICLVLTFILAAPTAWTQPYIEKQPLVGQSPNAIINQTLQVFEDAKDFSQNYSPDFYDVERGLPLYHITTFENFNAGLEAGSLQPVAFNPSDPFLQQWFQGQADHIYLNNHLSSGLIKAGVLNELVSQQDDHLLVLLNVRIPHTDQLEVANEWRIHFKKYLQAWELHLNGKKIMLDEKKVTFKDLRIQIQKVYHLNKNEFKSLKDIVSEQFNKDPKNVVENILSDRRLSLFYGRSLAYKGSIPQEYVSDALFIVKDELNYLITEKKLTNSQLEIYINTVYKKDIYDPSKVSLLYHTHREKIAKLLEDGLITADLFSSIEYLAKTGKNLYEHPLEVGILELVRHFNEFKEFENFSIKLAEIIGQIALSYSSQTVDQLIATLKVERLDQESGMIYDLLTELLFGIERETELQWTKQTCLVFNELLQRMGPAINLDFVLGFLQSLPEEKINELAAKY